MVIEVIVYVLTALGVVDILLTRKRLSADNPARRVDVGHWQLGVHTVAGVIAVVLWLVFLFVSLSEDTRNIVGIVALAGWWLATLAGLMLLSRWLPSHGRHAVEATTDTWSNGPWLSVLAHVGMLAGVAVFTWAYLVPVV